MREYKCFSKQTYSINEYQIVPIRDEDRYDIMKWRNEQICHLRQSKPLDKLSQDYYFNNVIAKLFEKEIFFNRTLEELKQRIQASKTFDLKLAYNTIDDWNYGYIDRKNLKSFLRKH